MISVKSAFKYGTRRGPLLKTAALPACLARNRNPGLKPSTSLSLQYAGLQEPANTPGDSCQPTREYKEVSNALKHHMEKCQDRSEKNLSPTLSDEVPDGALLRSAVPQDFPVWLFLPGPQSEPRPQAVHQSKPPVRWITGACQHSRR
ncbi:hypothetical protein RRG08_015007 [Elysia crispata]|uniref:Uncharacterized protein n=1 Tax=Elysia crispata TaxID=231223 RepID=A0AAE1E7Y8_9GAST|nr:hypothetical protein RRG08_015007 [Elysia crispata]